VLVDDSMNSTSVVLLPVQHWFGAGVVSALVWC
jgi:hypothetical protein